MDPGADRLRDAGVGLARPHGAGHPQHPRRLPVLRRRRLQARAGAVGRRAHAPGRRAHAAAAVEPAAARRADQPSRPRLEGGAARRARRLRRHADLRLARPLLRRAAWRPRSSRSGAATRVVYPGTYKEFLWHKEHPQAEPQGKWQDGRIGRTAEGRSHEGATAGPQSREGASRDAQDRHAPSTRPSHEREEARRRRARGSGSAPARPGRRGSTSSKRRSPSARRRSARSSRRCRRRLLRGPRSGSADHRSAPGADVAGRRPDAPVGRAAVCTRRPPSVLTKSSVRLQFCYHPGGGRYGCNLIDQRGFRRCNRWRSGARRFALPARAD